MPTHNRAGGKARRIRQKYEGSQVEPAKMQMRTGGPDADTNVGFAHGTVKEDPRSVSLAEKVAGYQEWSTIATRLGVPESQLAKMPMDQGVVQYFKDKQAAIENFDYSQWYGQQFNFDDPAQVELARKLNPDFFKKKLEYLDAKCELAKSIGMLNVLGPTYSPQLMELKFALDQGVIKEPEGNFWSMVSNVDTFSEQVSFQEGLFATHPQQIHQTNSRSGVGSTRGAQGAIGAPNTRGQLSTEWSNRARGYGQAYGWGM